MDLKTNTEIYSITYVNCCRCKATLDNVKFKYQKEDGVICKLCYEKEYRKKNKERLNKWHKKYADSHRETMNQQARDRYNDPNHSRKAKDKKWRKDNPDYIRSKANEEYKRKYKKDPKWTVARCVRRRFAMAIKNKSKKSSVWTLVGLTYEGFVLHIESLFKPGMTWENYGEWHLDHIEPLFKFDHEDLEQLKIVWYYKNIQPIWKEDHYEKCRQDGSYAP